MIYLFVFGVFLLTAGFGNPGFFILGTSLMIGIGILFVVRTVINVLKS